MKHKYNLEVKVKMYLEFDGEQPPDWRGINREILQSLNVGYFGVLKEFKVIDERHEENNGREIEVG